MTLAARLQAAKDRALLTNGDLAVWFDCPRSTVWAWLAGARVPADRKTPDLEYKLALLEFAIGEHSFPMPFATTKKAKRAEYVRGKFEDVRSRVSQPRSAG